MAFSYCFSFQTKQHGLQTIKREVKKIKLQMIIGLFQIYLLACGDLTAQALLAELRQRSISEGVIRNDRKVWLKRNVWGGETGLLWSSSFLKIIGPFLLVQQVHSQHQLKSAHWAPSSRLLDLLHHNTEPPSVSPLPPHIQNHTGGVGGVDLHWKMFFSVQQLVHHRVHVCFLLLRSV